MMQFMYRITPQRSEMLREGPTEEEDKLIEKHFQYLKDLADRGIVSLAGRTLTTDIDSHGIVIFESESEEDARKIVDSDPAVEGGVFKAELFPFKKVLIGKK